MRYEDENVWLTQKMMEELYGVSVSAINQHLKRMSKPPPDLQEEAVKTVLQQAELLCAEWV